MSTTKVEPGENLSLLASRVFNGDALRFTEILDLNPDLDVFGELKQELKLNIPSTDQIFNYAQPALTSVGQALQQVNGFADQATNAINQISGKLPPQLQGYAKEAIALVGEINGIAGKAQTVLDGAESKLREYEGQAVKLVPWLLGGRR